MENIESVREAAFSLASRYEKRGNPTTSCNSIYIAPTSNIIDTINLYDKLKSVLSVCSTKAHAFESLLKDATEIDLFDINELQILYSEILETAIKLFDYKTFIKHFTLPEVTFFYTRDDLRDFLCEDMYWSLEHELSKDVQDVFGPLYDYHDSVDLVQSNLFRSNHNLTLKHLKKIASFYSEDNYYKLQKILRSEKYKINVYNLSLIEVPIRTDKKYDLIILDNILQYYKQLEGLNTSKLVHNFISEKLNNNLNDNGVIQVNYDFEVLTDAFKDAFDIPLRRELGAIEKIQMLDMKRESVNIQLIKKYKGYYYDLIKGVSDNTDNLVLSYKKTIK